MFKEVMSKFQGKPKEVELRFGPVSVKMDLQTYRDIYFILPIQNTEYNLKFATEKGIKPLSLREIFSQIRPEELRNTVLFDTPPVAGYAGNHWRIIEVNKEKDSATLQLCGIFGNHDYDPIPPVNVPLETPMFTGVSIQQFELGGLLASLRETVKAVEEAKKQDLDYPKSLKHLGETILWSNPEGELVTTDKHPALLKRMKKATPEYRIQINRRGGKEFTQLFINKDVPLKREVEIIAQYFGISADKILHILTDVRSFLVGEYNFSESDFKGRWKRNPFNIFATRLTNLGISLSQAHGLVYNVASEKVNSVHEPETKDRQKEYWKLIVKLRTPIENPSKN